MFLTFKKWTAIYIFCLLGLFIGFAAILWHGNAVNVSKNVVLTEESPILIIDAGHGGEDGGAVAADGTAEAGINLAIALQMEELSHLLGREVVLTRRTDISLHGEGAQTIAEKKRDDLKNRVAFCNEIGQGVLISIHQNSLPEFPSTRGAQVFYGSAEGSEALAEGMQTYLNQTINEREKTCRPTGDGVYLLEHTECPSILVECGFLSNSQELQALKDPACTMALMQLAKSQGITVFVIGHVNKEGSIAGPKVLEHMVDCVLYFEGDQHMSYRILRAAKNRFGATNEIGVFEMQNHGLAEVENPSQMLLSGRPEGAPGTCVTCVMEGARPVLAEIQALLAPAAYGGGARRSCNGFDYNRAAMLLAVLEKRGGLKVSVCDAYMNIIGGLTLDEPAADLAAILALASSYLDKPIPENTAAVGEVGLTGELRAVNDLDQRLSEIQRLGFGTCVVPKRRGKRLTAPEGLTLIEAAHIGEAIRAVLGK